MLNRNFNGSSVLLSFPEKETSMDGHRFYYKSFDHIIGTNTKERDKNQMKKGTREDENVKRGNKRGRRENFGAKLVGSLVIGKPCIYIRVWLEIEDRNSCDGSLHGQIFIQR